MKAYYIETNDPDDGGEIVFADKPSQAKNQIYGTDIWPPNNWTQIRARRAPKYDGMESASPSELALMQWKDGWRWFGVDDPDVDEATDEEFLSWFKQTFESKQEASR